MEWTQACDQKAEQCRVGDVTLNVWPAETRGGQYGRKLRVVASAGWKASAWRDDAHGSSRKIWDGEGFKTIAEAKRAAETNGI